MIFLKDYYKHGSITQEVNNRGENISYFYWCCAVTLFYQYMNNSFKVGNSFYMAIQNCRHKLPSSVEEQTRKKNKYFSNSKVIWLQTIEHGNVRMFYLPIDISMFSQSTLTILLKTSQMEMQSMLQVTFNGMALVY